MQQNQHFDMEKQVECMYYTNNFLCQVQLECSVQTHISVS